MNSNCKKSAKIVVVGAGISGLAAAVKLHQHGFQNITVLEARNRVGGRIHSICKDDVTFEAGAQWLQEGLEKMLQEFPNSEKIQLHTLNYENMKCIFEDDALATKADAKAAVIATGKLDDMFFGADSGVSSMPTQSILSYLETRWKKYVAKKKVLQKPIFDSFFENVCKSFCAYDGCSTLDELSVNSGYEKIGEETETVRGSLSKLTQLLLNALPKNSVKCNCKVTKINWQDQDAERSPVSLLCETDESSKLYEYIADYVIITLPLGVLKKHHTDMFHPSLNPEKVEAINRLGFGVTNKIILQYDKPLLKNCSEMLFVWKKIDSNPPWWKSANNPYILEDVSTGKSYICVFLAGNDALEVEKLDQQDVGRICSEIFQKFLKLPEIPKPKFTHVTRWGTDRFCYGSYSFVPVGSRNQDFTELAKPLPIDGCNSQPKLLFAGEATHSKYHSTIHGAYYSGVREAQRIIDMLQ